MANQITMAVNDSIITLYWEILGGGRRLCRPHICRPDVHRGGHLKIAGLQAASPSAIISQLLSLAGGYILL